jgi:hypothetical protein
MRIYSIRGVSVIAGLAQRFNWFGAFRSAKRNDGEMIGRG